MQRSTVNWKLFSGRFISAVMTVHASNIAEYERVAISNNFTLGSGISQDVLTNSVWKHSLVNFQIYLSFEIAEKKCIIGTNYFYYLSFHVQRRCQDEDSTTVLRKLA